MKSKSQLRVQMIAVEKLKPHPRNYRTHPDDQLEHIIKSIKDHGFYRNVVAGRDWTILAGHGVVQAARKMKIESVPVIRLDLDPLSPKALKLLAGDNEIGHLGEIDDRLLTDMLKELKLSDEGLLGTGFDEKMLANLIFVTRPQSEIADANEAAQWVGMPAYEDDVRIKVTVYFPTTRDRKRFAKLLHLELAEGIRSVWWPRRKESDTPKPSVADFIHND